MIEVGTKLFYEQDGKIQEGVVTKIALDKHYDGYKTIIGIIDHVGVYRQYYTSDLGFRIFDTKDKVH